MRSPLVLLAVVTGLMLGAIDSSAATSSGAFIWSGFTQKWGYNHRYSRLGDYVDSQACSRICKAEITHTSASGLGPDTANNTSSWSQVEADGVGFKTNTTQLELNGKRGEQLSDDATVQISLHHSGSHLRNRKHYLSLLNGFDLLAKGESSKLAQFEISTSSVSYDKKRQKLVFQVNARARMLCSSAECSQTDSTVKYGLKINTVLIAADDEIASSSKTFRHDYSWKDQAKSLAGSCGVNYDPQFNSPGKELKHDPLTRTITGKTGAPKAFLGFRSLSFQASGEPHMLEFDTTLTPRSYNGRTYSFGLDLFFKNWANGMQTSNSPFSLCSFAEPGAAQWRAKIALVQLRSDARVSHKKASCEIKWPGMNKDPSDPQATCTHGRTFKLAG